ncbi:hypothetical protein [Mycobacterium bourgelatii]|uniref:Lipoprotein n=1 Tax=Mycobacterium bourgelatii TaxID=1273442 RepID=A0A7I9YQ44_MYCBU|nr:hypothetical protein [Mycobacterium bourgelatii]MCV6976066.1 hypothetical protein [Mycobacterium bourgelatii]GFG90796.1 hypothetical protein MBOU_28380 [Mycobacterium bourgelatii]
MRFEANRYLVPRCATAVLLVAGWVASAGVAAADPTPSPAPSPAPAPKTTIDHDGTFLVGTDIAPGVYSSAGPVGNGTCYWKRLANPDGALIDNALTKKPQVVRIEPTDKAFKTDGCQPWQSTPDAEVPNALPGPVAGGQLQINLGTLNGLLGPNGMQVPQP